MVLKTGNKILQFFCEKGVSFFKSSLFQTVKATGTRLGSNERIFDLVFESHQFFVFIFFRSQDISDYRWTKSFALGSNLMHSLMLSFMHLHRCACPPFPVVSLWVLRHLIASYHSQSCFYSVALAHHLIMRFSCCFPVWANT